MEILYRLARATAAEVLAEMSDAPGYSTVRKLLEILEEKGLVVHTAEGARYVYSPKIPLERASRSMLEGVVRNFFQGSAERAMEALLSLDDVAMSDGDRARLLDQIRKTKDRR